MPALPAPEEMFDDAQRNLGDALDWLRSDWHPHGTPLTDQQAETRTRMIRAARAAQVAIDRARP